MNKNFIIGSIYGFGFMVLFVSMICSIVLALT